VASVARRPDSRWRARYRDPSGREHAKHFDRKTDAQKWLDQQTAALVAGTHVAPRDARITVEQWCQTWLAGYGSKRESTVRQARVHIARIVAEFGPTQLTAVRPSQVKAWTAKLKADGAADSYVYALHSRLSQVFADAVHDGLLGRNPCSRRTSPATAQQRPYVATTEQVWALHDAMPERLQAGVLLGAFVGLRTAEACGLRVGDVDFLRGAVQPVAQYPARALKTATSRMAVPIPQTLALELASHVERWPGEWLLTNELGRQLGPWQLERAIRDALTRVDGLPDGFRFHDLRHYLASLLIATGADVKVVQTRLRHASATTTLRVYAHLWPDADESTRAVVAGVLTARADSLRTNRSSSSQTRRSEA
jgi:integrase